MRAIGAEVPRLISGEEPRPTHDPNPARRRGAIERCRDRARGCTVDDDHWIPLIGPREQKFERLECRRPSIATDHDNRRGGTKTHVTTSDRPARAVESHGAACTTRVAAARAR